MDDARIPYAACPLCDAAGPAEVMVADCSGHPIYNPALPRTMRWLACRKCGHIFVDGYFAPAALQVLFSSVHAGQTPGIEIEQQRDVWARVLETVSDRRPALGGRWLDVGFGNGALLTTAAEFGYRVAGLDLRAESVRLMREAGYEAQAVEFEDYRPAEPFDVISMADVLEHMPFPKRALHHAWDLLQPDGLLFLSMPNADAYLWHALTRDGANPYWGEIEHYHNFGRKRLYALLGECAFEPVRYGVSQRYRVGMDVIARKIRRAGAP